MIDTRQATLTWSGGDFAEAHNVYFGTDADAVAAATPDSGELFLGRVAIEAVSVGAPGTPVAEPLVPGETYYWRTDADRASASCESARSSDSCSGHLHHFGGTGRVF